MITQVEPAKYKFVEDVERTKKQTRLELRFELLVDLSIIKWMIYSARDFSDIFIAERTNLFVSICFSIYAN